MNRRELLKLVSLSALGLGAGTAFGLSLIRDQQPLPKILGAATDFELHNLRLYPENKVAVYRGPEGLAVVSLACTHLGCLVRSVGPELVCPCHQGKYTLEGKVIGGPPTEDLPWLECGINDAGQLYFYPGRELRLRRYLTQS